MNTQEQEKSQSIEAVRQGLLDFERYVNEGDLEQLMTLYFDDVKYMQHGFETIVDTASLKRQFASMFEKSSNVSLSIQEIDASGDMAYAHILTNVTLKPETEGADPKKVQLRVFEVWRQHPDGPWKLTRIAVNNPPAN